jgi:glycosyltransferase involved in cell wall biosynthesis
MKITFISWAPYCSRSDHIARELGGTSHMVYESRLGSSLATVVLKYAAQAWRTLRLLISERPDAVFVMTPPVFAVVAVRLYCRRAGIPYVIDTHTAAFLHPRWRHFQWLQDAVCRSAATTFVTNEHLARRVETAGGHATIVRDVPVVYDRVEKFETNGAFAVAVICSFNYDEPVEEIIGAARELSDVDFYVTGNPQNLKPEIATSLPSNMKLTGFLSDAAYGGLLSGVDAVLTLTTRNHTMLRGAYEAVYQGTPVIVSDWPLLRDAFDAGAVHVRNSAEDIVRGVRELRRNVDKYRLDVIGLRERKRQEWAQHRSDITARLGAGA